LQPRGSLRPRRRRRAAVPATARPVVTRRHAAPGTAACTTGRGRHDGIARHKPRNRTACAAGLLPSNRRNNYPGGDPGPIKGAPSARRFAMAQAPPLTGPGRESPGPHSACRIEGRKGTKPFAVREGGASEFGAYFCSGIGDHTQPSGGKW
jgi:hypothetical protein